MEWSFEIVGPGRHGIRSELAVREAKSRFRIGLRAQPQADEVSSTGGYHDYVEMSLAQIHIEKAGKHTVRIKPDRDAWQPINLRKLLLKPKWGWTVIKSPLASRK